MLSSDARRAAAIAGLLTLLRALSLVMRPNTALDERNNFGVLSAIVLTHPVPQNEDQSAGCANRLPPGVVRILRHTGQHLWCTESRRIASQGVGDDQLLKIDRFEFNARFR